MKKEKVEHKLVKAGSEVTEQIDLLEGMEITTETQSIQVGEWRVQCNAYLKATEKERKVNADPVYKSWKEITTIWKQRKQPFERAIRLADNKLRTWKSKQLRLAAEAEEKAQALAKKAVAAQSAGDVSGAREAFEQTQNAIAESVKPQFKAEGLQERVSWVGVLEDKAAFVKAALDSPELMNMLEVSQSGLNRIAKLVRVEGPIKEAPGVTAKKEIGFAS